MDCGDARMPGQHLDNSGEFCKDECHFTEHQYPCRIMGFAKVWNARLEALAYAFFTVQLSDLLRTSITFDDPCIFFRDFFTKIHFSHTHFSFNTFTLSQSFFGHKEKKKEKNGGALSAVLYVYIMSHPHTDFHDYND